MISLTLLLDGIFGSQSNTAQNDDDHDEGIKTWQGNNTMNQNAYARKKCILPCECRMSLTRINTPSYVFIDSFSLIS